MNDSYKGYNPIKLALRAAELAQKEGISELKRGIYDYVYYRGFHHYQKTRVDNEFRWEFIRGYIADTDSSLLDIGCAEGFFCKRAADCGLSVHGIDMRENRIKKARRDLPEGKFEVMQITPDSVTKLPSVDIVLALTVYHHWVRDFGWEQANLILYELMKNCRLLVFEPPPPRHKYIDVTLSVDQSSLAYYSSIIHDIAPAAEIVGKAMTEFKSENRSDPIFAVDCSNVK